MSDRKKAIAAELRMLQEIHRLDTPEFGLFLISAKVGSRLWIRSIEAEKYFKLLFAYTEDAGAILFERKDIEGFFENKEGAATFILDNHEITLNYRNPSPIKMPSDN